MSEEINPRAAMFLLSWLGDQSEQREKSIMDRLVQMHRGGQWNSEQARSLVAEVSAIRLLNDAAKREKRGSNA